MLVEILLNANTRDSFVHGYQPNHTLVLAASFEVERGATTTNQILEQQFERFNIGVDDMALAYRASRHRSLSVGDVVVLTEGDERQAFAVASTSWTKLDGELHIGKYECSKSECRAKFDSDADRYDHYENTGHVSLYY